MREGYRSPRKLAISVEDSATKKVRFIVQIEQARKIPTINTNAGPAPEKTEEELKSPQRTVRTKLISKALSIKGFTQSEECLLRIFSSFLLVKVEKIQAKKDSQKKEFEILDVIEMTQSIMNKRSYNRFLRELRTMLPRFFGFEDVGILIYDKNSNDLFTVAESD